MEIPDFEHQRPFEPAIVPTGSAHPGWWFLFRGRDMLLARVDERRLRPLYGPADPRPGDAPVPHFLGYLDGVPCHTAEVTDDMPAAGEEIIERNLYRLHGRMETDLFLLAGRAYQILEWGRNHRFCGRCGTPTEHASDQRARVCPSCGHTQFPRVTPAMMALIRRGRELLLARSPRYPEGFYSVLAGFAEPGETLEGCVRREVREEVGLEVRDIQYFGSQPWPFPHSLMVAFIADHAGGEIRVDGEEILDAGWYRPDALPDVPGEMSIAGQLIRWFVDTHR